MTPSGDFTFFATPTPSGVLPFGISAGPDGLMWFAESSGNASRRSRSTRRPAPTSSSTRSTVTNSDPLDIVAGPDNRMWAPLFNRHQLVAVETNVAPADRRRSTAAPRRPSPPDPPPGPRSGPGPPGAAAREPRARRLRRRTA